MEKIFQQLCNMFEKAQQLINLAEKTFGQLTDAEKKYFEAAVTETKYETNKGEQDTSAHQQKITLQADRIRWLCTDASAREFVGSFGIWISGAKIENTLHLEYSTIDFPLFLIGCSFDKSIILEHARIRYLDLSKSCVPGIKAERISVEGHVFLTNNFQSRGEVNFSGANIGGNLNCLGGKFHVAEIVEKIPKIIFIIDREYHTKKTKTLTVQNSRIDGSVFLDNGFEATGKVDLSGTSIGGILDCQGGEFHNPQGAALKAQGVKVTQAVLLCSEFHSTGEVDFLNAAIGSELNCDNGNFINQGGKALIFQGADIKNNILFRNGFYAEGRVELVDAKVGGTFWMSGIRNPQYMELDLRAAKINVLGDEKASWPNGGNLDIDGFTYEKISHHSTVDLQERLTWLRLQSKDSFSPQSYEQLARVFKSSGLEEEAKGISIAKHNDLRCRGHLSWHAKLWNFILGFTVSYGYRPQNVLCLIIPAVIFYGSLYSYGYSKSLMSPSVVRPFDLDLSPIETKVSEKYPKFNPYVYSLDVMIPVIDLHQQRYWLPNANRGDKFICVDGDNICFPHFGCLLRYLFWFQILVGWMLTSIVVSGFTLWIRRS